MSLSFYFQHVIPNKRKKYDNKNNFLPYYDYTYYIRTVIDKKIDDLNGQNDNIIFWKKKNS